MVDQNEKASNLINFALTGGMSAVFNGMKDILQSMENIRKAKDHENFHAMKNIRDEIENYKGYEEPLEKNKQEDTFEIDLKDGLNVENAISILNMIDNKVEEEMKVQYPNIEQMRRKAYEDNNKQEYEEKCLEFLETRNKIYTTISERELNKLKIEYENIANILQSIPANEIEEKMMKKKKPNFDNGKPNKEIIKEAFMFYGNRCVEEMLKYKDLLSNSRDCFEQERIMMKLMITKMIIDDALFLKYQISENQVRYLINEYNLKEDEEVKSLSDTMRKLDNL